MREAAHSGRNSFVAHDSTRTRGFISWIIETTAALSRITGLPFGAGVLIFAVPLYGLFSLSSLMDRGWWPLEYANLAALVWLALAPDLIRLGKVALDSFGRKLGGRFLSAENHQLLMVKALDRATSNRFLIFSVPLGLGSAILIWFLYPFPTLTRLSHSLFYAVLMFLAGIGFWGMFAMLATLENLRDEEAVRLDPFHWDGFGGFRCCGNLAVVWSTLFFSGSFLFPKLLDVFLRIDQTPPPLIVLAWVIAGSFIIVGLAGFIYSQALIRDVVNRQKAEELTVLKRVLDSAYADVKARGLEAAVMDSKQYDELQRFYGFFYQRVRGMREWPFDYKVILQLTGSALFPLAMALIELYRK